MIFAVVYSGLPPTGLSKNGQIRFENGDTSSFNTDALDLYDHTYDE